MARPGTASEDTQTSAAGGAPPAAQRSPARLLSGALGLLLAALLALLQDPWPDPDAPPTLFARLLYPLELHPELRLPQVQGQLNVLCAEPGGERLWAAGSGGLLLRSADGGASWRLHELQERVREMPIPRPTRKAGLQRWLPISEAQAGELPPEPGFDVRQQNNLPWNAQNAANQSAAPTAPPPAPAEPPPAEPGPLDLPRTDFQAMHCGADGRLWLAGSGGVVLFSADGGERWQRVVPPGTATVRGIAFADAQTGWLLSEDGGLRWTRDGGASWATTYLPSGAEAFHALALGDADHGWAVGDDGAVAAFGAAGSGEPSVLTPGSGPSYHGVASAGARAWAVGDGGAVVELLRNPAEPQLRSLPFPVRDARLRGVAAGDPDDPWLWLVGDRGLIRKAKVGENGRPPDWEAQDLPQRIDLSAILAPDRQRAWVAGAEGRLLRTRDGGTRWIAQTRPFANRSAARYLRLPAPWFYALALALWFWAHSRIAPAAGGGERGSVADLLVSDRPLRRGDPNAEQLSEIAAGLSRFLRNEHTEPPLTLAITGPWGSGKSSLMNLLRDDLAARGFRPVWFNAWHHQKGEQLLASLFAAIKRQGVPPLGSIAGFNFRLNLLVKRGWQRWFASSLMLLFLAALVVYVLRRPDQLEDLTRWLRYFAESPPDDRMLGVVQNLLVPGGLALPPVLAFLRAVRAFRMNPVALMNTLTLSGKDSALNQQPAARSRFAEEFEDVTEALGDFRLVLFIDDLDRCEALHVVEVLEAVNFLVSSGNCFIVLGMDDQWVQTCVGLAYEEIAEEHAELENRPGNGPEQRRRFARGYLEKLVNIEVPVPPLSEAETRKLLAPAPTARASRWARAVRAGFAYAPWLLVLVPLWLGTQAGNWLHARTPPPLPMPTAGAPAASAARAPVAEPNASVAAAATPSPAPAAQAVRYREGQTSSRLPRALVLLLVIPPVFYLLQQLARHQAVTQDSEQFRQALALWQRWLTVEPRTPRAIKRFLNRLRYIAMRDRREAESPPLRTRLRRLLRQEPAPLPQAGARTDLADSTLVALCAIHELLPRSLSADAEQGLEQRVHQQLALLRAQWAAEDATSADPAVDRLQQVLGQHAQRFPDHWPPTAAQIAEFLDILASARVR